jgi:hypothetical protein
VQSRRDRAGGTTLPKLAAVLRQADQRHHLQPPGSWCARGTQAGAGEDPAGYPRHKLFQKLSANHGYLKLREHLGSVVAIMIFSSTRDEFKARPDLLHPTYDGQGRFDLDLPDPGAGFRVQGPATPPAGTTLGT